jgi:hypothetical protein
MYVIWLEKAQLICLPKNTYRNVYKTHWLRTEVALKTSSSKHAAFMEVKSTELVMD